ncbi:50S ribosomal protein L11 methyltransferase [bacterium]|nr:50S ribosomal protein L11 methyltransferase [bacterium]
MTQNDSFFELKIKINPQMSELISDICFEKLNCEGVLSLDVDFDGDKVKENLEEDTLVVYLTSDEVVEDIGTVLKTERELLLSRGFDEKELGSWKYSITKRANEDWSKKWKENWEVTEIGKNIKVVPTTKTYEKQDCEMVINLDPETAFGTGCHGTTQLCVSAMEKYLKKNSLVADVGTGTGILAICAVLLGAKFAYGCDNDETTIPTAIKNAKLNKLFDKCEFEVKTADKITQKFDFVCANILHFVLVDIMKDLKNLMKDSAYLSLSGILDEKKSVVVEAINQNHLEIIEEMHNDIWVGFVCKKK